MGKKLQILGFSSLAIIFSVIALNHYGFFDEVIEKEEYVPFLIREWYEIDQREDGLFYLNHCERWSSENSWSSVGGSCGWSTSSNFDHIMPNEKIEPFTIVKFDSKYDVEDLASSDPTIHEKLDEIIKMEYMNSLKDAKEVNENYWMSDYSRVDYKFEGIPIVCYYQVNWDRLENGTDTNFNATIKECGMY